MPDKEKVIKGLMCCINGSKCNDCPYPCYCEYADDWPKQLLKDALDLLKRSRLVRTEHAFYTVYDEKPEEHK